MVYHGVRDTVAGALYRAGLVLLDLNNPAVVLARSAEWVPGTTEPYELTGQVPGVVFPCGLTHTETGELRLYYGAANTGIAMATARLDDILISMLTHPTNQPGSVTPPHGAHRGWAGQETTPHVTVEGTRSLGVGPDPTVDKALTIPV